MEKVSSPTADEADRQAFSPHILNPPPQPDASLQPASAFVTAATAPNAGQMFRGSFSGAMGPKKIMSKRDASSQPQSETETKKPKRSNINTTTREAKFLAMRQQYDLHMRNGNQIDSGIQNLMKNTSLLFKEHKVAQNQLQFEKNRVNDKNSLANHLRLKIIEIKESESAAKAEVERLTKEMKDKDAALIKVNEHMNNMEKQMETSKAEFAKILLHDMYRRCVQNFPLHFLEEEKAYFNRFKGDGCNDRDNEVGHAAATTKE